MQHKFVLKFYSTFSAHYPPPPLQLSQIATSLHALPLHALPPLRPCHLAILPPFPPWHLTPLTHLSQLATQLNSHTFPTFPAYYCPTFPSSPLSQWLVDTSNIVTFFHLGRQGRHMWLIVRQPLIKVGWWEAPLTLRNLAEAISKPGKCIAAILWHNPIIQSSIHQISTHMMHSTLSIAPSLLWGLMGTSHNLSLWWYFPTFYTNTSHFCFPTYYSFIKTI